MAAHRDFATKEAEQLDGRIPAITFAPMMTLHAEPFLRQVGGDTGEARATRAALTEKGYEFSFRCDGHGRRSDEPGSPRWLLLVAAS